MDNLRVNDPLSADWITLLLVVVLFTLGWINLVAPKKWRLLSASLFGFRLGRQSMRDDMDLQDRTLIGLLGMSTLVVSLFAYQVLVWRGLLMPGLQQWARLFAVCVGLVLVRIVLVRLCATLFKTDAGSGEYLYTFVLFEVLLGLALVPLTVLLAFPYRFEWRFGLAVAGIACLAIIVLFRWVRAVVIGLGEGVGLRYIFIYLCAAEILPFALAIQQARSTFPPSFH